MEKYNYHEAIKNDVLEWLNENYTDKTKLKRKDIQDVADELCDTLWIADSVTGNASCSYTCNAWRAEEMICHNTDLLCEAIEDFGNDVETYKRALQSAEYADVTIRCYLLGTAIYEALKEWLPEEE